MCQRYDQAVQIVLSYLVDEGFSRTARKEFGRAAKEFRGYLDGVSLEYSRAAAQAWLEAVKPNLPRRSFLSLRRSLALVEEALRDGSVTNTRFPYDDAPGKYRVPECHRHLLGAYVERRRQDGVQRSTLQMASIACRRFLLFLESRNITDVACVTPEVVKDFQTQGEHRTAEGKNAYIRAVRLFLRFLATRGLVPETLEFALPT